MKKGKLVIGVHAENLRLAEDKVLVRLVNVDFKGERSKLYGPDGKHLSLKDANISLADFGGYHPAIVEVIAVGPMCKTLQKGDIALSNKAFASMIHPKNLEEMRNHIELLYLDKEVFYLASELDFLGVVPTYRDAVIDGKIVKAYEDIDLTQFKD